MMKMFEIRQSSFQPSRKANESAKHLTLLTLIVFARYKHVVSTV